MLGAKDGQMCLNPRNSNISSLLRYNVIFNVSLSNKRQINKVIIIHSTMCMAYNFKKNLYMFRQQDNLLRSL